MSFFVKSCLFLALALYFVPAEVGVSQCCRNRNFETSTVPVWDQIGMIHPFQKSYGPPVWEQIGSLNPYQRTYGYPPVWEQIGSLNPYQRISLPPITPCTNCLAPALGIPPTTESRPEPEVVPGFDATETPVPDAVSDKSADTPGPDNDDLPSTLAELAEKKRQAREAADNQ